MVKFIHVQFSPLRTQYLDQELESMPVLEYYTLVNSIYATKTVICLVYLLVLIYPLHLLLLLQSVDRGLVLC